MRIFGTIGAVDESTRSVEILASTAKPVDGEALVSWDLGRWGKNPVILWAHDANEFPIGRGESARFDSDGLKMRAFFAPAEANPEAEKAYQLAKGGFLRAVSVRWEPGKTTERIVDGKRIKESSANELLEVSFVSIPKDEDAGIITPSRAASVLARSRMAKRTDGDEVCLRFDDADVPEGFVFRRDEGERLAKFDRTSTGGAIIPARVARTGILTYMQPDGTTRREYRPPEEVFKADSLASLNTVPVIDFVDHRALVTPDTFRQTIRGTSTEGRRDGKYVAAELRVEDRETLDAIDRGERSDVSAGYVCRLDFTPGVFEGEPYDAVQRDIRFNHVALCPPNRGRSGPDVGLRLDALTSEKSMKIIKLDGKDYEFGSEAHLEKLDSMQKEELSKLQKRIDALEGEKDGAKEEARKLREEMADDKKEQESERKKGSDEDGDKIRQRVRLYRTALRLIDTGSEDEDEPADKRGEESADDTDEKRAKRSKRDEDLENKMDGMSDREVMLMAIRAHSKDFTGKDESGKERSIDYVRSRFDSLDESVREHSRVHGVAKVAAFHQHRLDTSDAPTDYEKAKAARDKAMADAWKSGTKR